MIHLCIGIFFFSWDAFPGHVIIISVECWNNKFGGLSCFLEMDFPRLTGTKTQPSPLYVSFTCSLKKEKSQLPAMRLLYWLTMAFCIGVLVFPSLDGCNTSKFAVFDSQVFSSWIFCFSRGSTVASFKAKFWVQAWKSGLQKLPENCPSPSTRGQPGPVVLP